MSRGAATGLQPPQRFEGTARLRAALEAFVASVAQSRAGQDYPEGKVDPSHPARRMWHDIDAYKPYFDEWRKLPAYSDWSAPE